MAQRMFCDKCQEEIKQGEKHVWVNLEVHDQRKENMTGAKSMREYHPQCWDEMGAVVELEGKGK